MKHLLSLLAIAVLALTNVNAQTEIKYGLTGGLLNNNTNIDIGAFGFDIASIDAINETGFYIGAFMDIPATEDFHIQPELTYGKAGDLEFFYLPVMAKYYIFDRFNIQAGPQLSFSSNINEIKRTIRDIEDVVGTDGNIDDVIRTTGVDLGFGLGFDITDRFFAQARYAIELTNRYDGPLNNSLEIKPQTLMVGVGFSF